MSIFTIFSQVDEIQKNTERALAMLTNLTPVPVPMPVVPVTPVIPATPTVSGYFVNPHSQVQNYINANPNDPNIAKLQKVASQPTAIWLTGGTPDEVETQIRDVIATAAGKQVTFVIYNIPHRDNGGQSAGGAADEASYYAWLGRIDAVLDSLGNPKVTLIMEPDAIGFAVQQNDYKRTEWVSVGVQILTQHISRTVYLDVAMWADLSSTAGILAGVDNMAKRIFFMKTSQGLKNVTGFALNTSGYNIDSVCHTFGEVLVRAAGWGKYIVDTSRNGAVTQAGVWENAPGWKIGALPHTQMLTSTFDGNWWVKLPGESDGADNGAPQAGQLYYQQLVDAVV